jgi:exosome complex RNA-binding protein Rrp4
LKAGEYLLRSEINPGADNNQKVLKKMDLVAQLQAIEEAKKQELLATKRKYGQLYDGKIDELAFKNRDNGEFLRKEVSKSQMRMQAVKSGIYV